jgi:hypothetical protein
MPRVAVQPDSANSQNAQFLFSMLGAFCTVFGKGSHPRSVSDEYLQRIVGGVVEQSQDALLSQTQEEDAYRILDVLLSLIETFGDSLFTSLDHAEVGMLVSDSLSFYSRITFLRRWMRLFRSTQPRY